VHATTFDPVAGAGAGRALLGRHPFTSLHAIKPRGRHCAIGSCAKRAVDIYRCAGRAMFHHVVVGVDDEEEGGTR
jgi:hypothetical protein